ncbi:hypothetical protein HanIR_Chr14g0704611 [Helianthus annuus]|nr:hypothetical protein HanIR_Chr14g0704611 [Helianthus annuus]
MVFSHLTLSLSTLGISPLCATTKGWWPADSVRRRWWNARGKGVGVTGTREVVSRCVCLTGKGNGVGRRDVFFESNLCFESDDMACL